MRGSEDAGASVGFDVFYAGTATIVVRPPTLLAGDPAKADRLSQRAVWLPSAFRTSPPAP
jgi:hypothetical protein